MASFPTHSSYFPELQNLKSNRLGIFDLLQGLSTSLGFSPHELRNNSHPPSLETSQSQQSVKKQKYGSTQIAAIAMPDFFSLEQLLLGTKYNVLIIQGIKPDGISNTLIVSPSPATSMFLAARSLCTKALAAR